uniref:hypothetical protein n=1 Tax=Bacteroides eggerthii TaxID=28111 RepID=UPI00359C810F
QKPGQQNVAQELIKIIINYVAELRLNSITFSKLHIYNFFISFMRRRMYLFVLTLSSDPYEPFFIYDRLIYQVKAG